MNVKPNGQLVGYDELGNVFIRFYYAELKTGILFRRVYPGAISEWEFSQYSPGEFCSFLNRVSRDHYELGGLEEYNRFEDSFIREMNELLFG